MLRSFSAAAVELVRSYRGKDIKHDYPTVLQFAAMSIARAVQDEEFAMSELQVSAANGLIARVVLRWILRILNFMDNPSDMCCAAVACPHDEDVAGCR